MPDVMEVYDDDEDEAEVVSTSAPATAPAAPEPEPEPDPMAGRITYEEPEPEPAPRAAPAAPTETGPITADPSWGEPVAATPKSFSAEDVRDWGAPTEHRAYHVDETKDWGIPEEVTSGAIGAAFRGAAESALPGLAGGAAGLAAAPFGAAAGAVTSPVTGPVGPIVGAVGAGMLAGVPAATATRGMQDWIIDALGWRQGTGMFSEAQRLADETRNKWSRYGGELVGGAAPTFGVGAAPMVGQRI